MLQPRIYSQALRGSVAHFITAEFRFSGSMMTGVRLRSLRSCAAGVPYMSPIYEATSSAYLPWHTYAGLSRGLLVLDKRGLARERAGGLFV